MSAPRFFVSLGCTVLLAACGNSKSNNDGNGGGTAVTCDTLTPSDCGGDPSGDWKVASVCGTATVPVDQMLPAACAGTVLTATPGTPTGTATFTSGNYQLDATIALSVSANLDAACMTAIASGGDVGATCIAIGPASSTQGLSLTCTPQSGACACSGSLSQSEQESGTYAVSGNELTLTPTNPTASATGDGPTTTNFCVRDSSLIIKVAPLSSGSQPLHLIFSKQ